MLFIMHYKLSLPLCAGCNDWALFYDVHVVISAQSSRCGRNSWVLYFHCILVVVWVFAFCVSSSRCHGLVWDL